MMDKMVQDGHDGIGWIGWYRMDRMVQDGQDCIGWIGWYGMDRIVDLTYTQVSTDFLV